MVEYFFIFFFIYFFIVSQEAYKSRDIIYDHSAKSVLSKILIKKEWMFFTKSCWCSLPRRVGRSYVQGEKIKTKKWLCTD